MPDADTLRDRLRRKAQEAGKAAETGGDVPPETIDALNRLARLVEIHERTAPPAPAARWPIAALLAATLILASLLLFLRVDETEIELELVLSDVGFVLAGPQAQAITGVATLAELRAAGLSAVQTSHPALSERLSGIAGPLTMRLAAGGDDHPGSVTLNPVVLPADTAVRIRRTGADGLGLLLRGEPASLGVTLFGPVDVDLPNTPSQSLDVATPRSLTLETSAAGADLDLRAPGTGVAFAPQIAIAGLTLFDVDEFAPAGTTPQPVSTILSGTVYFESLNGAAHQLRSRELLRFDRIHGVIRTLRLDDDRIALNVRATARGLRRGWTDDPTSMMPTYLEWLQARHGLSLLWGTALYLFGLITMVLRWWRALP